MIPEDVDEPVEIVPADPGWRLAFELEARRLVGAVGPVPFEHIGSTAVPGLAAKPIVDIMAGVEDVGDSQRIVDALGALGYEDCGGAPGRRYLRLRGATAYNVQIVEHRGPLWRANLLFREHLRGDSEAARRYEQAKYEVAERAPRLLAYSEAKAPAVERILAEARRESA